MPAPRRLRRTEIGRADPPAGTTIGADVVRAPLVVERGYVRGTSLPGAGDAFLELEKDNVEGTFTSEPRLPAEPSPFVLAPR